MNQPVKSLLANSQVCKAYISAAVHFNTSECSIDVQ